MSFALQASALSAQVVGNIRHQQRQRTRSAVCSSNSNHSAGAKQTTVEVVAPAAPAINRRLAGTSLLLAGSAFALPQPSLADDIAYNTYKRSFRTRFETSISSGTRNYTFDYPADWEEEIVSLNDGKLYGVDLRLRKKGEGQLAVAVLPYVGRESIEDAGSPEEALNTFVELVGAFWENNGFGRNIAGSLNKSFVVKEKGQTYYRYELTSPHNLISANATDGQLYVINASCATEREWQRAEPKLRRIIETFRVPL